MWLISLTCGLIKRNSYSSSPLTWVETQVLSSVATMWLISLNYALQSLPRRSFKLTFIITYVKVCRGRRLIN
jgi:hypothetical protein